MRPSFNQIYMQLAHDLAARSTCGRLQVGTVISSWDYRRILAVGYNGGAAGLSNECDSDQPGQCGHIHSEENAIINCTQREPAMRVFVTHCPCLMCARKLINFGASAGARLEVYYDIGYRSEDGLEELKRGGIHVEKHIG